MHIYSSQAREKGPTNACAQEPQPFFISQEYPVHLFPSNVLRCVYICAHDPHTAPIPPPPSASLCQTQHPETQTPTNAMKNHNEAAQAHEAHACPHEPLAASCNPSQHAAVARAGTVHYALVCSSLCLFP